jgi:signal peptidase
LDRGTGETLRYVAVFAVLLAVAFGGIHVLRLALGTQYPMMVVVSESMVPTLGVGDYIFVGGIDDFDDVVAEPYPEGDILVFVKPGTTDEYIVHRAIDRVEGPEGWSFVTKGDNNPGPDGRPVPAANVLGRVIGRAPILGYFSLFIKTMRGFALVALAMAFTFFIDYIIPLRGGSASGGRFPYVSLIPFLVAPLALASFWLIPNGHLWLDLFAIAGWYLGCLVAPLAFEDDDLGVMFWLYHFVLLIIPLGCDAVWWTTGITPSRWWSVQGSTVPLTWLLVRESPFFQVAFLSLLRLLIPGMVLYFAVLAAKRRGVQPLSAASVWIRGGAAEEMPEPEP